MPDEAADISIVTMNTQTGRQRSKELLNMFNTRNISGFKQTLKDANPDHFYGKNTILVLACQQKNCDQYIDALLKANANPNLGYPILYACKTNNYKAIKQLLQDSNVDVNVAFEDERTILHILCFKECSQEHKTDILSCISLLLRNRETKVNKPDNGAYTPIMLAVENYNEEQVEEMLKSSQHKINLDLKVMVLGQSPRELIAIRFPHLLKQLPEELREDINSVQPENRLLAALQNNDLQLFTNIIQNRNSELDIVNNFYDEPYYLTCFEFACRKGKCLDFIKVLYSANAKFRDCHKAHSIPLVHFVVNSCCSEVLQFLLINDKIDIWEKDEYQHTVLHVAAERHCISQEENMELRKCVQLILEKLPSTELPTVIDGQDRFGDTALHDATLHGNNMMTLVLLQHGANLMVKNKENKCPLNYINKKAFEVFLDYQLVSNSYSPHHEHYKLIFNYSFLTIPSFNDDTNEMEPFMTIINSDLQTVLAHPMLHSFIYLKWKLLKPYFIIDAVFYIIFMVLLTLHILLTPLHEASDMRSNSDKISWLYVYLQWIYMFFLFCLALREGVQFFTSKLGYWKRLENYLDLAIVVFSIGALLTSDKKVHTCLTVTLILISWWEFILLTGSFPRFSIQLQMLKQVMLTFLQYMAWYFLLIIPFAMCFHILFLKMSEDNHNFFNNFFESVFKTTVMLTGEFDVSSLDFTSYPVLSHIVLVLFVIAMSVVLLNLLSGLAVSDTQQIQNQAKILSLVSMIKLLHNLEEQLHAIKKVPILSNISRISCIHLFPKTYRKKIQVYTNSKKIKFLTNPYDNKYFRKLYLQKSLIAEAIDLVTSKRDKPMKNISE